MTPSKPRRRSRSPLQSLARFVERFLPGPISHPRTSWLRDYDTEELVAELEARGWSVREP